ncbi:MAG: L-aspartate oxidase [Thermoproteota archaeon]|nr:L-aspartate oxidase [Candidatus Brockarchaeota archaeon]
MDIENKKFDVIVVGSGIAGLYSALSLKKFGLNVVVVTKDKVDETNTSLAQGGMAVALSKEDSIELHLKDTIESGAGISDENVVRILVSEAKKRVEEFIKVVGIQFERKDGEFDFALEGGHSLPRILHIKDKTGEYIQRCLVEKALHENLRIVENAFLLKIITEGNCVTGIEIILNGKRVKMFSDNIVLATGGSGQLYKITTNAGTATGDGIVIAYRAGAMVSNLEFVQFHPTAIILPDGRVRLITEAIRGAGAKIINDRGERFICKYDKRCELATRDIVSRAIYLEMQNKKTHVYLDLRSVSIEKIKKEFEGFYETMILYKKDITKNPIEIAPAAHYMNGGIKVNEFSQSNLEGLYAVGEASCTGVHGANRLASNSLLEAVVFSSRAVEAIVNGVKWKGLRLGKRDLVNPHIDLKKLQESIKTIKDMGELKEMMWNNVGIIRERKTLEEAILMVKKTKEKINQQEKILDKKYLEFINMLDLSELIASAALIREESRGCHYRKDFPNEDEKWKVTINFVLQ